MRRSLQVPDDRRHLARLLLTGAVTIGLVFSGAVSASAFSPALGTAPSAQPEQPSAVAAVTPPQPPTNLQPTIFSGSDGTISLEGIKPGSFGSATSSQISYVYDLNGDNVWHPFDTLGSTGFPGYTEFSGFASAGLVNGNSYTLRLKARATIDGRIYDSAPSAGVTTFVYGPLDRSYKPTATVSGDSVTVSWNLTKALNGQRARIDFATNPDLGASQPVGPVGSVTLRVGYGVTVSAYLNVEGEIADVDTATFGVTVTTGSAGSGAPLTQTPTPTVIGTPSVGSILTAQAGTWKPQPVTLGYQWLRNGSPITGATSSQYRLVAQDAGATLSVSVTGRTPGGSTATLTSGSTAAITTPAVSGLSPIFDGNAVVGNTLTANVSTVTPVGAAVSFQWNRNGVPIASATRQSYVVSAADLGSGISVTMTARKTGYAPQTLTTYASDPVTARK